MWFLKLHHKDAVHLHLILLEHMLLEPNLQAGKEPKLAHV